MFHDAIFWLSNHRNRRFPAKNELSSNDSDFYPPKMEWKTKTSFQRRLERAIWPSFESNHKETRPCQANPSEMFACCKSLLNLVFNLGGSHKIYPKKKMVKHRQLKNPLHSCCFFCSAVRRCFKQKHRFSKFLFCSKRNASKKSYLSLFPKKKKKLTPPKKNKKTTPQIARFNPPLRPTKKTRWCLWNSFAKSSWAFNTWVFAAKKEELLKGKRGTFPSPGNCESFMDYFVSILYETSNTYT